MIIGGYIVTEMETRLFSQKINDTNIQPINNQLELEFYDMGIIPLTWSYMGYVDPRLSDLVFLQEPFKLTRYGSVMSVNKEKLEGVRSTFYKKKSSTC